jgi:UDP-N-acetylmuramoyl-tripeptide--D-alanyl-D-alanine ligase
MTIKEILKATKGKIISGDKTNTELGKICIDSRILEKGEIFLALKGEKKDASTYIKDVINIASLIITETKIKFKNKTPIIKVKNTKKALIKLAQHQRKKYIDKPLIAITGSVGKTTTKELIASILKTKYNVLKTKENYNNIIGVSLMLTQIEEKHDIIILELGMNHLNEIKKLSKLCKPQTAIITNIGTSHIGNLKTQENILKAKLEIIKGMKKGDLIINGNDFYLNKIKPSKKISIIKTNEQTIKNIDINENLKFEINLSNNLYKINFDIPNKYLIENILLAIQTAIIYEVKPNNIIKAINNFKMPNKRSKIINLDNNIILIDDTYNSSLESIKSSLSLLENIKKDKLVILGDTLELGEHTTIIHQKIQEELEKIKNLKVITIGEYSKVIKIGKHFNTNRETIEYLKKKKLRDIAILIKASRKMHLEEIKEYIERKYKKIEEENSL